MKPEQAEVQALKVLGWLVSQDEWLGDFLASSGLSLGDLRERAQEAEFLSAMMEFILQDDSRVIAAAQELGIPPAAVATIHAALPGGASLHWT